MGACTSISRTIERPPEQPLQYEPFTVFCHSCHGVVVRGPASRSRDVSCPRCRHAFVEILPNADRSHWIQYSLNGLAAYSSGYTGPKES